MSDSGQHRAERRCRVRWPVREERNAEGEQPDQHYADHDPEGGEAALRGSHRQHGRESMARNDGQEERHRFRETLGQSLDEEHDAACEQQEVERAPYSS